MEMQTLRLMETATTRVLKGFLTVLMQGDKDVDRPCGLLDRATLESLTRYVDETFSSAIAKGALEDHTTVEYAHMSAGSGCGIVIVAPSPDLFKTVCDLSTVKKLIDYEWSQRDAEERD